MEYIRHNFEGIAVILMLMASKKNRTKQKYGKENRPSIKINK